MKKTRILLVLISLQLITPAFAQEAVTPVRDMGSQEPQSSLSDELQRTRELLAIWKEHVKEVTEERDEAFAELEKVKNGAGPAEAAAGTATPPPAVSDEQVSNLTRSVDSLKAENATLRRNEAKMKAELERLQNEPKAAAPSEVPAGPSSQEWEALNARLSEANARTEDLQNENAALKEQVVKAGETLSSVSSAGERTALLEKQIEELRVQAAEAEKQTALANETIKDLKSQAVRLSDENGKLKAESESLHSENAATEADKQKASQSYMRLMTQSKEETASLKATIAELEAKAQKAETLTAELEKTHASAAEAQAELAEIRRTSETQIADAKADAEVARQAYADLEQSSRRHDEETGSRILSLTKENEALKKDSAAAQAQLKAVQAETAQLKPLQGQVDQLRSDKTKLEQYVQELKAVQGRQQKQIDELEVRLSTVNLDVEGFRTSMNSSVDVLARKYAPKK